MEIRKTGNQARNVSARRLHFNRNGDGVTVVFNEKDQWQAKVRRRVHRFPKFAFTGGAVAERDVGDLVAMELDIFELAVISGEFLPGVRVKHVIAARLSTAYGVKNLGSGARGLSNNIQ